MSFQQTFFLIRFTNEFKVIWNSCLKLTKIWGEISRTIKVESFSSSIMIDAIQSELSPREFKKVFLKILKVKLIHNVASWAWKVLIVSFANFQKPLMNVHFLTLTFLEMEKHFKRFDWLHNYNWDKKSFRSFFSDQAKTLGGRP